MATEVLERPQKLTDLNTKTDIINRLANEEPGTHIARSYGVDRSRISQIKTANEELINKKKAELISKLPSVIETVTKDVKTNHNLSTSFSENIDNLTVAEKLQLKAQLDKTNVNILKIAGIFPSQALLNFNQYNQDNRTTNIEASIMSLFSGGFSDSMQVIDMNDVSNDGDNGKGP